MSELLTFSYGPDCRTRGSWLEAGPSDIPRLNAEFWAAEHGAAGYPEDGGYMLFYRVKGEAIIWSQWWPEARALNQE